MTPAPGTVLSLTIDKPAAGGRMIARVDGQVVLVAGAIPGERVSARVERAAKGVLYAAATAIDERSPDRRDAPADPLCGGCLYSHIAYPRQLAIKAAVVRDAFARIGRVELPGELAVAPSREDGYRMRARLHMRGGRVGFFREGSHELCDARVPGQLLPEAVDAIDRAAAEARAGGVVSGELELSENVPATERAISLDGRLVSGSPHVHDVLRVEGHDVAIRRHVLAFFQGNRYLLGSLVGHVAAQVDVSARVVDFYAGSGLFSIPIAAARGALVVAVEGDRHAFGDLAWNARNTGVEAVHAPVEAFAARPGATPDIVVVDPPRTGMSRDALSGILGLGARRIVYVSCDVATLARDARRIIDAGHEITCADAFDMFPNTPHVETVVVLERR